MRNVKRLRLFQVAVATAAVTTALIPSPWVSALPFSNCSQAEMAGATPILAGQPGYSRDLDRDGDGVACEQGSASGGPVIPPAVGSAPGGMTQYTTTVVWFGSPCVEIDVPDHYAGTLRENPCAPSGTVRLFHTAAPGQMIGADPIMGSASTLGCSVRRDYDGELLAQFVAAAGDGTDVNCIIPAR